MSKERQEHFQSLCEEGAAILGVKPDAPIAKRYATLTLAHEACGARLINGSGNPDTLVKIEEQLATLVPAKAVAVPTVTLKVIGTCIHCDREFDDMAEMAPHRSRGDNDRLAPTIEHDLHEANPKSHTKPVAYDPHTDRIKAPVPNFTPPKPVEDPNRRKTYAELNAISRDFHKGGFSKDAANGGALDQWLGAHTSPTRPFEPALDPNMKPRTEGS